MKKHMLFAMLAIASVVILTACGAPAATPVPPTQLPAGPAPTQPMTPMTIKFGQVGGVTDAGIDIAQAKGYFAEQGLTVQLIPFTSANDMVAPLGTDELQVGGGTVGAGLFNAIARGVAIVIVADKGNLAPGHGNAAVMVRTPLIDTIKGPKDLKGRNVALVGRDITADINLDIYLRTGGLTLADVNIVTMAFPDMQQALKNGSVDAAIVTEPTVTRILSAGIGRSLLRSDQIAPNQQVAVVLFSQNFAAKREAAIRFMVAYIKGTRLYNDAFDKKDPAKRAEVIDILSKSTKLDADLFNTMVMPKLEPDGKVNTASLDEIQAWFVTKGSQKEKLPMNKIVNTSFAEEAARRLGPYQP